MRLPTLSARWRPIAFGLVVVVLVVVPFRTPPFAVLQLTLVAVVSLAVASLVVLTGHGGLISLGQGAFFAIGAYAAAVVGSRIVPNVLLQVAAAVAVTFVVGWLLGLPAIRIRGVYLAIVTLGLALVLPSLLKRFSAVTGGSQGLRVARSDPPAWTGLELDQWQYLVCLALVGLGLLAARRLTKGVVGRSLVALRDNELSATMLGVDAAKVKTLAFAYSSALAGGAGALYTYVVGFVSPETFTILFSIDLLAAMVLGGSMSIAGAIVGAGFVRLLPTLASEVSLSLGGLLYGFALILAVLFFPDGLAGIVRRVRARTVDRLRSDDSTTELVPDAPERQAQT